MAITPLSSEQSTQLEIVPAAGLAITPILGH